MRAWRARTEWNPFGPDEVALPHCRIVRSPSSVETACATVAGWTLYAGLALGSLALLWLTCPWPVALAVSLMALVVRPGYSPWGAGIPPPTNWVFPLGVGTAAGAVFKPQWAPTGAQLGMVSVAGASAALWLGVLLVSPIVWATLDRFEARFARSGRRTAARLMNRPNVFRTVHVLPGPYEVARYPFERVRYDFVAYTHHSRRYLAVIVVESMAGVLDRRIAVHLTRDPGPYRTRGLATVPLPPTLREELEWTLPGQLVELGGQPYSYPGKPADPE